MTTRGSIMRISVFDKVTTFSQRLAARGHAHTTINHARFKRQQGATAIEYAIIAAIVVIALLTFVGGEDSIGDRIGAIFTDIKEDLPSSTTP